ncbi:NAD(P)-dependent oxidoreductase [Rhizobacter sp. Root404]|uniref:NAD(P)-dependent oxidoreductase n=1 Tax=Rhizobacter sp. Root404 TaxID=1736528 RepID=UPI0006F84B36|nr:NAD(P)-dependent oxidoreductase [Rhizobacter sp. Root404]KQW37887.1 dihydropyrimidine dehydrogenase [Rhizobacter sp. Root404]
MPQPDVKAGRLDACQYTQNFGDAHPPLTPVQALIEAERCYYCHDAPCVNACPTGIDIPSFIRRISEDNLRGAARAILEANIFGGMCARVCPTEVLCEQACVRNTNEDKPVEIGLLQRHATDHAMNAGGAPMFVRGTPTGRRIAVVGAGPAGLACAHRAAMLGHEVTVFEAKPKPGGLNEYGLATYKTPDDFAQKEIAWLLSIGGIEIRHSQKLGEQVLLADLAAQYDAVFLGLGLGGVNALGLANEGAPEVGDAVQFIAGLRQANDVAAVPVGRRVVVIGGGMTAIDAAVQSRKLGAQEVTIVYRRDQPRMPASKHEQDWAKLNGVAIREWSVPKALDIVGGQVEGVTFATVQDLNGQLVPTGKHWSLEADTVLKAIGQTLVLADPTLATLALRGGRIAVDGDGRTSLAKVWAGGDCTWGGKDLTVEAVEHGKIAAQAIDRALGFLRQGQPFTRVRRFASA